MDLPSVADALLSLPELERGRFLAVRFVHGEPTSATSIIPVAAALLETSLHIRVTPREIDTGLRYLESIGRLFLWRHYEVVGRPPSIVFASRPEDRARLDELLHPTDVDAGQFMSKRAEVLDRLTRAWAEVCDAAIDGICYEPLGIWLKVKLGLTTGQTTHAVSRLTQMGILERHQPGSNVRRVLRPVPGIVTSAMYSSTLPSGSNDPLPEAGQDDEVLDESARRIWLLLCDNVDSHGKSDRLIRPLIFNQLGLSTSAMRGPLNDLRDLKVYRANSHGFTLLRRPK